MRRFDWSAGSPCERLCGRRGFSLSGKKSGASAEITSAVPLTEAEKETIRQDILSKTGSQTVTFRTDPSILGGLVIKVGDKVVDGSVASQLDTLRQSLR